MNNELFAFGLGVVLTAAAGVFALWWQKGVLQADIDRRAGERVAADDRHARERIDLLDRIYDRHGSPPAGADVPALRRARAERTGERNRRQPPELPANPREAFVRATEAAEREKTGASAAR